MEQYVFKFGQEEFLCQAPNAIAAKLKADVFIDREREMTEPYGWVPTSEARVFRMSVGA